MSFKKGDVVKIVEHKSMLEWGASFAQAAGHTLILDEIDADRINKKRTVHPWNNRYGVNFDHRCFKPCETNHNPRIEADDHVEVWSPKEYKYTYTQHGSYGVVKNTYRSEALVHWFQCTGEGCLSNVEYFVKKKDLIVVRPKPEMIGQIREEGARGSREFPTPVTGDQLLTPSFFSDVFGVAGAVREESKKDKLVKNEKNIKKDGSLLERTVLPDGHREAILQALCQTDDDKHKKLFETWGLGETIEKGKGLIFMFYGPPGTGKTMCAQGIAEHLGQPWMLLGTAELQSSVPGQMERNIKKAFAEAKAKGTVLILDECDSLLYNRNHVGVILGAEINCLLSEIERHEGVVILTTNRSLLLDPALERRIALKLAFQAPDKAMRQRIWESLLPKKLPLAPEATTEALSSYALSGGQIKNVLLSAARRAAYENRDAVSLEDFIRAAEQELAGQDAFSKHDKVVSAPRKNVLDGLMSNGNGKHGGDHGA